MPQATTKPLDAAGLVLIRDAQDGPEVLLGRRQSGSRFMPNVYVFPGGQVDKSDRRLSSFREAGTAHAPGVDTGTKGRLMQFARAAIRETHEETGLLFGRPAPRHRGRIVDGVWEHFAAAGLAPAFDAMLLFARAITPATSPIRFHTRFFLGEGSFARGTLAGGGELEDLRWVPVDRAGELPLAEGITDLVLREALAHRGGSGATGVGRSAALFRWVGPEAEPAHRIDTWTGTA